jgi:hypothetical protein
MEVEVVVKYDYEPCCSEPCKANIEVYLPVDDNGDLIKELQSTTCIFGSQLSEYVGQSVKGKDCRMIYTYVKEKTWEDLEDDVEDKIVQLIADLRSVKNHNAQMMSTMPQERHSKIKI